MTPSVASSELHPPARAARACAMRSALVTERDADTRASAVTAAIAALCDLVLRRAADA